MTSAGDATLRPAPVPIAVAAPTAFASASTCTRQAKQPTTDETKTPDTSRQAARPTVCARL